LTEELRTEAVIFARYLVRRDPSALLVDRYVRANEELFAHTEAIDHDIVAFARRHPWSIGMLDASAGIIGGSSLLRKKLLLMTALVETTPELVDRTEPRSVDLPRLVLRVGTAGVRTVFNVVSGLALQRMLRRRG
jgi:hypothetical protein